MNMYEKVVNELKNNITDKELQERAIKIYDFYGFNGLCDFLREYTKYIKGESELNKYF